jgi:hypothetical protein
MYDPNGESISVDKTFGRSLTKDNFATACLERYLLNGDQFRLQVRRAPAHGETSVRKGTNNTT